MKKSIGIFLLAAFALVFAAAVGAQGQNPAAAAASEAPLALADSTALRAISNMLGFVISCSCGSAASSRVRPR